MHFAAQTHVDNSFGNSFAFTKTTFWARRVARVAKCLAPSNACMSPRTKCTGKAVRVECLKHRAREFIGTDESVFGNESGRGNACHGVRTFHGLAVSHHQRKQRLWTASISGKAIPKFIMLAKRGLQIPLHGDGMATRSYMHVRMP